MNTRSALAIVAVRASLLALMLALGLIALSQPVSAIAADDCAGAATGAFPMLAGSGYEWGDSTSDAASYAVLLGSGYEEHDPEPACAIETSSERSRSDATVTTPATADELINLYAAILAGSGYRAPASGTVATAAHYPVLAGSGYDIEISGQQVALQEASSR